MASSSDPDRELVNAFRAKAAFLKDWKPASAPSNRDRLELYALHKQAASGDAPAVFSSGATPAERAKYQVWRSKVGLEKAAAMRDYLREADRQYRVYGSTLANPQTPNQQPAQAVHPSTPNQQYAGEAPRGLAAVPLLCAATAESRQAYIRRLGRMAPEHAWWRRQEALCGTPGTITALPEALVLFLGQLVEHLSLGAGSDLVRAFFWPLHNALLGLWMLVILVLTTLESTYDVLKIVVWGARATGLDLARVWDHDLVALVHTIHGMCEPHQATTCRLVGLSLLPVSYPATLLRRTVGSRTLAGSLFVVLVAAGWWYFFLILPWTATGFLCLATASGSCFALIEAAGSSSSSSPP